MTKMKLNEGDVAVIEAMFDGCNTISGLTERLGQSPFTIRAIVRELELNGIVSKVSRGHSPKLLISLSEFNEMKDSTDEQHIKKLNDICDSVMENLIHIKMCGRTDHVQYFSVRGMMSRNGLVTGRDSADVDKIMAMLIEDGIVCSQWTKFDDGLKQVYKINWDSVRIPENAPVNQVQSPEIPREENRYRGITVKSHGAARIDILIPKEWKVKAIKLLKFDGNYASYEFVPFE